MLVPWPSTIISICTEQVSLILVTSTLLASSAHINIHTILVPRHNIIDPPYRIQHQQCQKFKGLEQEVSE